MPYVVVNKKYDFFKLWKASVAPTHSEPSEKQRRICCIDLFFLLTMLASTSKMIFQSSVKISDQAGLRQPPWVPRLTSG